MSKSKAVSRFLSLDSLTEQSPFANLIAGLDARGIGTLGELQEELGKFDPDRGMPYLDELYSFFTPPFKLATYLDTSGDCFTPLASAIAKLAHKGNQKPYDGVIAQCLEEAKRVQNTVKKSKPKAPPAIVSPIDGDLIPTDAALSLAQTIRLIKAYHSTGKIHGDILADGSLLAQDFYARRLDTLLPSHKIHENDAYHRQMLQIGAFLPQVYGIEYPRLSLPFVHAYNTASKEMFAFADLLETAHPEAFVDYNGLTRRYTQLPEPPANPRSKPKSPKRKKQSPLTDGERRIFAYGAGKRRSAFQFFCNITLDASKKDSANHFCPADSQARVMAAAIDLISGLAGDGPINEHLLTNLGSDARENYLGSCATATSSEISYRRKTLAHLGITEGQNSLRLTDSFVAYFNNEDKRRALVTWGERYALFMKENTAPLRQRKTAPSKFACLTA